MMVWPRLIFIIWYLSTFIILTQGQPKGRVGVKDKPTFKPYEYFRIPETKEARRDESFASTLIEDAFTLFDDAVDALKRMYIGKMKRNDDKDLAIMMAAKAMWGVDSKWVDGHYTYDDEDMEILSRALCMLQSSSLLYSDRLLRIPTKMIINNSVL
jgi:hypothetical protein